MLEKQLAEKFGGKIFPEENMRKIVQKHAVAAAIVIALPAFGIDWIIYCIILWHMYSKLGNEVGAPFGCATIIFGVLVNIVLTIIFDLALTYIPILGWITAAGIVYLQFYISGRLYIDSLRKYFEKH